MTKQSTKTGTILVHDVKGNYHQVLEETVLEYARKCIQQRFENGEKLTSTDASAEYFRTLIGSFEHEVFYVTWLNNQHAVIKSGVMFRGTVDGSAVYPREVVKEGLACNAAAAIFAHNHPSGSAEPSQADIAITRRLKSALELVDIRVLDHVIVGTTTTSLASQGLL